MLVQRSTFDNLAWALRRHVLADPRIEARAGSVTVLDVGRALGDEQLATLFEGLGWRVVAADRIDDVAEASVDVVLAIRHLDADTHPWRTFASMVRACRDDGVVVVLAASFETRGPAADAEAGAAYRFGRAAFEALATDHGLALVECSVDRRGPTHDTVAVFRKGPAIDVPTGVPPVIPMPPSVIDPLMKSAPDVEDPLVDVGGGNEPYLMLLQRIHDELDPSFYLEIGVDTGSSLTLAACPAVGIDPAPRLGYELAEHQLLVRTTSDDFFRSSFDGVPTLPIDLAFIDGMHLVEFAFMDFLNVERRCSPWSLVVIDDVFPVHPRQAQRARATRFWTGDVWKLLPILEQHRPDLLLIGVDTAPTGLLLVIGADPSNDVLWEGFDELMDAAVSDPSDPPQEVLRRTRCIGPTDPLLGRVLRHLGDRKRRGLPVDVEGLRRLVDGAMPRAVGVAR